MDNNNDLNLIEKYLTGKLSDTEKQSFDNRMTQDETLAEEFQRHQNAHKALDFMVAQNLKDQLQEMEEESKIVSLNKRRRTRLTVLSLAASVLVLVATFFVLFPQDNLSNQELAAAYYEVPDFGVRGDIDAPPSGNPLEAGIYALQNNDSGKAITHLGDVDENDPDYLVAQYFLGHAYYTDGQFDRAAQQFALVANSNDLRYVEAAQWYELLSCLARDAACNELLSRLTEDASHAFNAQAKEINRRSK